MSSLSNVFTFPVEPTITLERETSPKYKILVVEDEPVAARHMLTTLTRAGMECRHAPDGRICLEALKEDLFHLMLLDLTLPGVSGQEICRHIRATSTMPVMVVTAQDALDAQIKSFRSGADDFLTKPFSPQVLMLRVMALLRRTYIYNAPTGPLAETGLETGPETGYEAGAKTGAYAVPEPVAHENSVPPGWNRCEYCGYMGPSPKFEQHNLDGRPLIACPNCGDKAHVAFALG